VQKTILIVDDDTDLRVSLRKILTNNNFRVLEAADGAEALEIVESELPELVILDFGIPTVPGETVCVKIKENHPEIIVIALTKKIQSSDVIHGLQIGADDYISKPFMAEELIARIDTRIKNPTKKNNPAEESADPKTKTSEKSEERKLIFRESTTLILIRLFTAELLFGLAIILSSSFFSLLRNSFGTSNTFVLDFSILLIIFLVNIAVVVYILLRWESEYVELTSDSLIKHKGILNKTEQKYACNFVEAITLNQSLMGILFNYGTIELYDPALKEQIYLTNIANPKRYREIIEQRVSKDQNRSMPFIAKKD